jgi:dTDP-4-amino-4,6-dideoxygalactose transaminase
MVPEPCAHNAHVYYLLLADLPTRTATLARLNAAGVNAIFHYVPLHLSPAGRRLAGVSGNMTYTETLAERLIRLPLWAGMTMGDVAYTVDQVKVALAGV